MDQYISKNFMKWFTDDSESFKQERIDKQIEFNSRKPFKHIILKDLFYDLQLKWSLIDFNLQVKEWIKKDASTSKKWSFNNLLTLTETHFYNSFLLPPWLQFLERITGIPNLIPDPYFFGGGFHNIPRGGFLKMHVDFNIHDKWRLDRRLNVLIFLNENWKPEWGGDLILGENAEVKIPPLFNTTVIFETTDKSWHGHPEPLTCPEGESRKSIALYYYTATNMYKDKPHTTIYKE